MILATPKALFDSFWTKYGNFGQSACCQEGYECGGTIADKPGLKGGRRQGFFCAKRIELNTK